MGNLSNESTRSQLSAIRKYLLHYGKIDKVTALRICGCERLAARIWQLRAEGMDIITDYAAKTNQFGHSVRYAVYRLRRAAK